MEKLADKAYVLSLTGLHLCDNPVGQTNILQGRTVTDMIISCKSTLLTMPGEIRNNIYRAAIVSHKPVEVRVLYRDRTDTKHLWSVTPLQPALAFTRKTIQDEVLSIYYSENTFRLVHLSHLDSTDYLECLLAWYRFLGKHVTRLKHLQLVLQYLLWRTIGTGQCKAFAKQFVASCLFRHVTLCASADAVRNITINIGVLRAPGTCLQAAVRYGKARWVLLVYMAREYAEGNQCGTVVMRWSRCNLWRLYDSPTGREPRTMSL